MFVMYLIKLHLQTLKYKDQSKPEREPQWDRNGNGAEEEQEVKGWEG